MPIEEFAELFNHMLLSFAAPVLFLKCNPVSAPAPALVFSIFIPLVVSAFLIGAPGIFIFPSAPPTPPDTWIKSGMDHNFWRPIPKKGAMLIRLAAIYGFVAFFIAALFSDSGDRFAGFRAISGIPVALFVIHWISYWYHSPLEIRKDFILRFRSKRHEKRHRKHDQEQ